MASQGRKELTVAMLALVAGFAGLAAWIGPRIGRNRDAIPDRALVVTPADGRPLPAGAQARLGFARTDTLPGRTEVITASYTHDGKRILAADWTGAANMPGFRLWDAESGKPVAELPTPIRAIFGGSLSPDGTLFAWGGNEGEAVMGVSEVATGNVLWRSKGANYVAFSRDGKHVVGGYYGGPVVAADARTGAARPLTEPNRYAETLAVSSDGTTAVAYTQRSRRDSREIGTTDARIEVWDVATAKLRKVVAAQDWPFGSRVALAISGDGRTVGWSAGKTFTLVDVTSGAVRWSIENPGGNHVWEYAALSPAGDVMFAARTNYDSVPVTALELLDANTGRTLRALDGEAYQFCLGSFSPDGQRLLTFGQSVPFRVWDVSTGKLLPAYDGHRTPVQSLAISHDGGTIASCDRYAVCLWDGANGTLRRHLDLRYASGVSLAADGRTLLVTHDSATQLIDPVSGNRSVLVRYRCYRSAVSPDGTKIAVSRFGNMIEILDRATGKAVQTLIAHDGDMYAMAFSGDGRRLLTAARTRAQGPFVGEFEGHAAPVPDDTVRAWDLADGRELRKWEVKASCAAISPDGRTLFAGCADGRIRRMSVDGGKPLEPLALHAGPVSAVAVSSNGLTASSDGTGIVVWRSFTGTEVKKLSPDHGATSALAFSGDGRRLASTGTDGTILLWSASDW